MSTVLGPMRQDTDRDFVLTLKDSAGAVVDLSPVTALAAVLAPGSGLPAVATLSAAVLGAAAGTITLTVAASAVSALAPGRYSLVITATSAGRPLDAARDFFLDLEPGVGTATDSAVLTVALAEAELVGRLGGMLHTLDLDETAVGGNAGLQRALRAGLRSLGMATAYRNRLDDADLAALAEADEDHLYDVAELKVWEQLLGHHPQVDFSDSNRKLSYSHRQRAIAQRVAELRDHCRRAHGYGLGTLAAGSLDLAIGETDADLSNS